MAEHRHGGTHQSRGGGVAHKLRGYSIVTAMRGLGTRSGSRFAKQIMAKSLTPAIGFEFYATRSLSCLPY